MQSRSDADKALSGRIPEAMVRQFLLMNLIKVEDNLTWRINLPVLKANYPQLIQAVCENTHYDNPSLFIRGVNSNYVQDYDIAQIKTALRRRNLQIYLLVIGYMRSNRKLLLPH